MKSNQFPGRALVIGLAFLVPLACHASDGTVQINGTITNETCSIAGSGGPGANVSVTLPKISTSTLNAANATAGNTQFSIALTGCQNVTAGTVSAYFEIDTTKVNLATGRLINSGTAGTNVEIELLNSGFQTMNLAQNSGGQSSSSVTLSGGAGTLVYYARYHAIAPVTLAGTVIASTTFTIVYP